MVLGPGSSETALDHLMLRAHARGSMSDEISRCTSCAPRTSEDTRCRQDVLRDRDDLFLWQREG